MKAECLRKQHSLTARRQTESWRCFQTVMDLSAAGHLPGENDIYVSPAQIRRFNLKTGDIIQGNIPY